MLSTLTPVAITLLAHPIHVLLGAVMLAHGARALLRREQGRRTAELRAKRPTTALVVAR